MRIQRAFAALHSAVLRFRRLATRGHFELDLDEEMRFHFESALAQRIAQGMTPAAAREQTLKEFGSMALYKDEVRDARGITITDDLWRDLRFGVRSLRRARGFAIATIATIALGIGAGSAVFSLVNAVLLRPLPYPDADRLVGMWHSMAGLGIQLAKQSPGSYMLYEQSAKSFDAMGVYVSLAATIDYRSPTVPAERVRAGWMTASMFGVLGAKPILGRVFADSEGLPSSPKVVLISERLWRERFDATQHILDMSIDVDGRGRRIIGVMRRVVHVSRAQSPDLDSARSDCWAVRRRLRLRRHRATSARCLTACNRAARASANSHATARAISRATSRRVDGNC